MVRAYYHIYAVDGVESIIDEQLYLINKHFTFPYILNIGINVDRENKKISNIISKLIDYDKRNYLIRDIRIGVPEFTTLDLILDDVELMNDDDKVFYLHTKGASKINATNYNNIVDWRNLLMYFNVERVLDIFEAFKTDYNTFGCLFKEFGNLKIYDGNFWWAKGEYIKTLNLESIRKNKANAEMSFIQKGENWKPYTIYNSNVEHYHNPYPKEKYKI
jgi:hypothetical protein